MESLTFDILIRAWSALFIRVSRDNYKAILRSVIFNIVLFYILIVTCFSILKNRDYCVISTIAQIELKDSRKSLYNYKKDTTLNLIQIGNSNIKIIEPLNTQLNPIPVNNIKYSYSYEYNIFISIIWILFISSGIFIIFFLIKLMSAFIQCFPLQNTPDSDKLTRIIREIFLGKFNQSENFLRKILCKYKTHDEFINDFETIKGPNPIPLNYINKSAENSSGDGIFKCVVSNQNYFEESPNENMAKQTIELLDYFFESQKSIKSNSFRRIFSFPSQCENKASIPKSIYSGKESYKNKVLFQYLLINKTIGVETFLLFYDKNHESILDFIPKIDYVLANVYQDDIRKSILYFSYKEDEKGNDQVLSTEDELLIKIAESDFHNKLNANSAAYCKIIEFPKSSKHPDYKIITNDMLCLNNSECDILINDLIFYIKYRPIANKNEICNELSYFLCNKTNKQK